LRGTFEYRTGAELGFTLVEVLVALAVLAVSLTAIGSLVAVNIRGTWKLDQRLASVQTARAIIADLPDRTMLGTAILSGAAGGSRWRVGVRPFAAGFIDPRQATFWVPQAVTLNVQSAGGRVLQINTVRLGRSGNRK
jgi:general secretion pathway protein I